MDTRTKIVSSARLTELVSDGIWSVLAGTFDPLTSEQTKRIAAAVPRDGKLAVVVEPGAEPLLPVEARAALIAALRTVSVVTIANSLPVLPPTVAILQDKAAEQARTQAFADFIVRRQAGARS